MVCEKVKVVQIERLIRHGGKFLKDLKALVPNVSQLFHFRKSRRIHVVAGAGFADEIQFCRNAMQREAGEPLPISDEAASQLLVADVQRVLEGLLEEGEEVVEDPLRATWDDGPRVIGIRAAMQERRTLLIHHVLNELRLLAVNVDGNPNAARPPIAVPMMLPVHHPMTLGLDMSATQMGCPPNMVNMGGVALPTSGPTQRHALNVQAKSFVPAPTVRTAHMDGTGGATAVGGRGLEDLLRNLSRATGSEAGASVSSGAQPLTESSIALPSATTPVPTDSTTAGVTGTTTSAVDSSAAAWAATWYDTVADDDEPPSTDAVATNRRPTTTTESAPFTRESSCGMTPSNPPSREPTTAFFGSIGDAQPVGDEVTIDRPASVGETLGAFFRGPLVEGVVKTSAGEIPDGPAGVTFALTDRARSLSMPEAQLRVVLQLARDECCRVCGEAKPLVVQGSVSKVLLHMVQRKPEKLVLLLSSCMGLFPDESLRLAASPQDSASGGIWVALYGAKDSDRRATLFRTLNECMRRATNLELMLRPADVDALAARHSIAVLTRQRLDEDEELIASATVCGSTSSMEAFAAHVNALALQPSLNEASSPTIE